MTTRFFREEPVDQKLRSRRRAPCGHLRPCGCETAACCFGCPLVRCRYDGRGVSRQVRRRVRRAGEARRLRTEGLTVKEVAEKLGVAKRTVYKWISSEPEHPPLSSIADDDCPRYTPQG